MAPTQPCPGAEHLPGPNPHNTAHPNNRNLPLGQTRLQPFFSRQRSLWPHSHPLAPLCLLHPTAGCCPPSSLLFCHLMAIFRTAPCRDGAGCGCICRAAAAGTQALENPLARFPSRQRCAFSPAFSRGDVLPRALPDKKNGLFVITGSACSRNKQDYSPSVSTDFLRYNFL